MKYLYVGLLLGSLWASPLSAEPTRENPRTEREDRTASPYSNREQAKNRRYREAARQVVRDREPDHYRFRRVLPREQKKAN